MERLERMGVIRSASSYVSMVRFLNVLVHQYEQIDLAIVYGIASRKLGDVDAFLQEVRRYVQNR